MLVKNSGRGRGYLPTIMPEASNKLSVTVSIGVTFVREEDTLKSIVDRADRLLFKAKQAGRDRIMIDADVPLVGKIERADIR